MIELDVHVFPKAARVVILQGFGISESLGDIKNKNGDKWQILGSCFSKKKMVLHSRSIGTHIHPTDLKHWVGEKQSVPDVVQEFSTRTADSVELQDFLGGLCLAGSALP